MKLIRESMMAFIMQIIKLVKFIMVLIMELIVFIMH